VLPIVVPLVALGAAGYLARNRNTSRSVENASSSAYGPSPLTVLGAFLHMGETPPLEVVVGAVEHAESLGYAGLASELVQLFLLPTERDAYGGHGADLRGRGVTTPGMAASVTGRATGNSVAEVAAALGSARSSASSAAAAPPATWSRTYPAGWPAPMPAASGASASSPGLAVSPMNVSPANADPANADVAASSQAVSTAAERAPAPIAGPAVADVDSKGVDAEAIDAEAQRVLEMLADPARRAAKVELLSGPAAGRGTEPQLEQLADLDRHAAKVELLPMVGSAATVEALTRRAPMPEIDVEAQRDVLEERTARVEVLPGPGATRDPEVMLARSSPIDGVAPAAWLMFVGQVSREAPTFSGAHHVGRFRQRRDRLLELGIDPAKVIDSPEAQLAALDADMLDAYKHAYSSGLVDEYLGTKVELRVGAGARPAKVTLSGVLGVIQAAGLEGAVQWLEQPADRTRFPNTTQAFLRCNGVF